MHDAVQRSQALRLIRFLIALVRYRDVAYARRLWRRSRENLALVLGSLGSRYVRPNLEFHVHDATRPFPIQDGEADVVFSSEVIEHLSDGDAFLRAAARALKPGGLLLLKTPNDDYNRYENRLNPHHVSPYSASRLQDKVQVRFEAVRISGLTYDVSIDRETEERPDPLPPEDRPYRFGDPIVVDRSIVLRMRVTPRRIEIPGPEVPEYLWVRASRTPLPASQEVAPLGR